MAGWHQHQAVVLGLAVEFEREIVALECTLALKRVLSEGAGLGWRSWAFDFLHTEVFKRAVYY